MEVCTFNFDELNSVMLGRQGENGVRQIVIDLGDWPTVLDGPDVMIVALRPGEDSLYVPAGVTIDGSEITWEIDSVDTALDGAGYAEIRLSKDGAIKKSHRFTTKISRSLMGNGEPAQPQPPEWAAEIMQSVADATTAAEEAAADAAAAASEAASASSDAAAAVAQVAEMADEVTGLKSALEDQRQTYNWLPQRNYYSQVQKGNPCTINERTYSIRTNGEILVTGATSATGSTYYISRSIQLDGWDGFILPAGTYRFYTKEDISAYANIGVRFPGDSSWQFYFSKNGNIQTIEADTAITIGIEIKSSRVLPENGILVQPMIVRIDEDYGYIAPWASLANYVPQILEENSEHAAQIASIENQAEKKADVLSTDETESDLDITDRVGNVLVRFASGHIRTKEFDSASVMEAVDILSEKIWAGKKWAAVGDSLTEVNQRTTLHYHDYIAERTGITVANLGHSGAGYYARPNDYSFQIRAGQVPLDSDVVTIFGSGNDVGKKTLGNVTDAASADTLCGYINNTFDLLFARFPTVNLGVITPTPWKSGSNNWTPENPGNPMELYSNAIVEICKRRSIPCLDLYHCSNLRPMDAACREAAYSKDDGNGIHPDETGHFLIAARFEAFLGTLLLH